jgi:hypothetical protein
MRPFGTPLSHPLHFLIIVFVDGKGIDCILSGKIEVTVSFFKFLFISWFSLFLLYSFMQTPHTALPWFLSLSGAYFEQFF